MPLGFTIERNIPAPSEFVHHWWIENGPSGPPLDPDKIRHSLERIDPYHARVRNEAVLAERVILVEGLLEVRSVSEWEWRASTTVNGVAFTEERTHYRLRPEADGSRLTAAFEFSGATALRQFLLRFSAKRLRAHRERQIDGLTERLVREFRAQRPVR